MSLVNTYRGLEEQLANMKARLEQLKSSPDLRRDVEFEEKMRALMVEYEKSPGDVMAILSPEGARSRSGARAAGSSGPRAQAKKRIFKNPYTGEVVELVKTNNLTYRGWVDKYGANEVAEWEEK